MAAVRFTLSPSPLAGVSSEQYDRLVRAVGLRTRPRRLVELGLAEAVTLEEKARAFAESLRAYDALLTSGEMKIPTEVSRSGALAILHLGGRRALAAWPEDRWTKTKAAVARANGIF